MTDLTSVWVGEVVVTKLLRRGDGTENNPIRIITEVWTRDGQKIAEDDPCPRGQKETDHESLH